METEVLRLEADTAARCIARGSEVLRGGGLVAFPTETVYGLGADARNPAAVRRIFEAKGRPTDNPLIVHVADVAGALRVVAEWPDAAARLADRFWPGPLTLVLPRGQGLPSVTTAGLDSVAVRVPAHPFARALIAAGGGAVAAPSANPSTTVSPPTAEHVMAGLDGRIELVIDGGPTTVGIESTVVSLLGEPRLLRPGDVGASAIAAVVGPLRRGAGAGPKRSPGMMARHYAPTAELLVVPAEHLAARGGPASAALVHGSWSDASLATFVHVERLPNDPTGYARGLYAALRRLDRMAAHIVVEAVPDAEPWAAVADRLGRAAR